MKPKCYKSVILDPHLLLILTDWLKNIAASGDLRPLLQYLC
jgi:hypothetical protein